jgi:gamma-glutamyltranspeptidase/glutathione hydrolase
VIRGALAIGSNKGAEQAASAALDNVGSAVDAVIAGFFAHAGSEPGVLLSPVAVLVAGVGAGARAIDGRSLQPGKGAQRPRGWKSEAEVPDAARVGVPRSLGVMTLLHTSRGRTSLSQLVKPGVLIAENAGATARASLLRRFGSSGQTILRSDDFVGAIVAAAGPVVGGALTADDLESALPEDLPAKTTAIGDDTSVIGLPWDAPLGRFAPAEVILACDGRGIVVVLAYAPTRVEDGVLVPELGIALGKHAHPVRRGIPRTKPGTPLDMPAPIAIAMRSGVATVVALLGKSSVDENALAGVVDAWSTEGKLEEVRAQTNARSVLALLRDARDARALRAVE